MSTYEKKINNRLTNSNALLFSLKDQVLERLKQREFWRKNLTALNVFLNLHEEIQKPLKRNSNGQS